jgi:hydrogenase expression/formation protein HypE
MSSRDDDFTWSCPLPNESTATVQLAHGGGGRAMARLLDTLIRPAFADIELDRRHDGAVLDIKGPLAFTTDSYVVQPLIFPGGDIGTLAINGTINDLAMCGAQPLYLSVGLILEEGLPLTTLRSIIASMSKAALVSGVRLVTGDTKVVDHGKADGIFINTAGIGQLITPTAIGPAHIQAGDGVILSGDIGRHGMAVMAAREGFGFETAITSDCAPLAAPIRGLLKAGIKAHCLRDLTRGGLASALVEIAETAQLAITIDEALIPISAEVTAACEVLGLDPLHVANEGRFIAFIAHQDIPRALAILRDYEVTRGAVMIGEVGKTPSNVVSCLGTLGIARVIDMLSGEQLPRIC